MNRELLEAVIGAFDDEDDANRKAAEVEHALFQLAMLRKENYGYFFINVIIDLVERLTKKVLEQAQQYEELQKTKLPKLQKLMELAEQEGLSYEVVLQVKDQ